MAGTASGRVARAAFGRCEREPSVGFVAVAGIAGRSATQARL